MTKEYNLTVWFICNDQLVSYDCDDLIMDSAMIFSLTRYTEDSAVYIPAASWVATRRHTGNAEHVAEIVRRNEDKNNVLPNLSSSETISTEINMHR